MTGRTEANIEVDETHVEDNDSTLGDEISAFTASITSSVLDYPVENGRRYHAFRAGAYYLPNDELEQDRLDLSHALMTKAIGDELFLAPIDTDKIDRILGNDLSAIQPPWVPPNVRFEIDDVECPWVYERPFDFIFCRYMTGSILDWPTLVGRVYENLAPGAWAEFQDFDLQYYSEDGSLTPESSTLRWINTFLEASRKAGREPCPGPKLEEWARDAGFTNIEHRRFRLPIGPWAKDPHLKQVGMYNISQIMTGLEAFSLRLFCGVLGWKENEVLVLLTKVRSELKEPKLHAQFDYHVVYGQKKSK
ncbi:S-adenosyl-L-methionine-dependent methyltransferase [Chaetomium sp. MPI-SDFR-AT-0129]|nr:S-adenosyl-L-methionine-dependent methyltransferase [Chaetomium sp. MPI-SDFR-AT-0129]